MSLLSVAEAQARLLAMAPDLPVEHAALLDARGRILADPVIALRDQPATALSAMDGYAIRHAELPGPWTLTGESSAGAVPPTEPLKPGTAMRIFTGAPLPPDADTVVVQEDVEATGTVITLTGSGPGNAGRHVRPRASDFAQGMTVLEPGTLIGPAHIALAAMAGHATLPVRRRARIAILSTGDELVPPGAPVPPGKIPSSNDAMLSAMLTQLGAEVVQTGLLPDDLAATTAALTAARSADIIVTIGGASVGDRDLVKPAVEAAGGSLDFWRIAMRPGKPLMAGTIGDSLFVGLPGNPVSAFVTATVFLLPVVRKAMGCISPLPDRMDVATGIALPPGGQRQEYLRGVVADGAVTGLFDRDSAALLPLAAANVLIERAVDAPPAKPGDRVTVIPIAPGVSTG
jgi:molybdopterin molybdotransferase